MFETYQQRCREKTSNNFHLEDVVYCGGRTVFVQSLKRSAAKIMTREALGSSFDSKLSRVALLSQSILANQHLSETISQLER